MHPDVSGSPGISGADAEPEDISTTFPYDEGPELIESMEDETYLFGPASGNMFCRMSLPPAPDERQSEPPSIDPRDEDQDVI
eukprot:1877972-Pyramimonas_sp.AAC.1